MAHKVLRSVTNCFDPYFRTIQNTLYHAPHQHVDTEIILMIDGETEMIIDGKTYKAGPGDLYIVESGKMHGISNTTDKPSSYFAFKWR